METLFKNFLISSVQHRLQRVLSSYGQRAFHLPLHIYMAKIINFGNTYRPFLKIFLVLLGVEGLKAVFISQKENPGCSAKAHDWTKHANFMKDTIDSCSKIGYNKIEIL